MKKLLILFMCFSFVLCGCSSGEKKEEANTAPETSKSASDAASSETAPEPEVSEFYAMATGPQRPIAVMIDNDSEAARPQIGMESAYIVYEVIVEGGASRFMALFKNYEIEKVGPVRSSRHYFLDYALENDAVYAHAGWSPQAQSDISKLGVNNINGILGDDGRNFWRDSTYDSTYHNLYTSVKKLAEYAEDVKGYGLTNSGDLLKFSKTDSVPDGKDCESVDFKYSNMYRVGYTYNAETGLYERSVNGKNHMSQTGDVLTAKNIIVYNVANYDLNDGQNKGRQNLNNVGSGEGWYISSGKAEKITWSKSSRSEKTVYKDSDGNVLTVNPGLTFIQIVPQGNSIDIK